MTEDPVIKDDNPEPKEVECDRCGKKWPGGIFYEFEDTKSKWRRRLCKPCGVSFSEWWKLGKVK